MLNEKKDKIFHLHIYELNRSPITSREHCENFKAPAVAEPRWSIFEDLNNLQIKLELNKKIGTTIFEPALKVEHRNSFTFIGCKLTRPQARAATPLHLCEMAKMPTESGPG